MRRLVSLLVVAATAAACATDADGAASTTASTEATTTAPASSAPATSPPTTEAAPVPGAELVGRWAHYDVVAYEDDLLKTLIISYGFNDFAEVDGQIVDQASFCSSEQRTDQPIRTSLSDATLIEPDRITGVVTDESEQLVIGASDPAFAISPANWRQHPDLSKSPIILVRVDDDWDCDRLAAERSELFPPTPEVDW